MRAILTFSSSKSWIEVEFKDLSEWLLSYTLDYIRKRLEQILFQQ